MKPTLSEALRDMAERLCPTDTFSLPTTDIRALHEAADALDAASAKPVFSDFNFKECTITPEEEKRVRQTGRYLSEHDHLEFWQLDGRVYVLNSRVNPKPAPAAPEKPACEHGQPVSGSWGDITRPDWIDVPFTQPFATPVLMVEAAEHLRSYAVSQERCAHFWREKFKQEASDHAATQGSFDSGFGKPSPRNASLSKEDIVLALPVVDAGPLAQLHIEELHRLLAPVLDAAGFAPGQEKAENAINRLLMQWRSGLEPRVPPAPSSPAAEPTVIDRMAAFKPAAERADEGLREATQDDIETAALGIDYGCGCRMSGDVCQSCIDRSKRVARAARALRRGGVTEAMRAAIRLAGESLLDQSAASCAGNGELLASAIQAVRVAEREIAALDSGASVVVDREEISGLQREADAQRERADALAAKLAEAEKRGPDWACAECGSQDGFDTVRYEAGDADMACRACGSKDVRESLREAAHALGEKFDAARAEAERLRGEVRLAEAVSAVHEANAAPTVAVTDVERAAMTVVKKFGLGDGSLASEQSTSEEIAAILRDCTRAASVEEVAKAVYETEDWVPTPSEVRETVSEGIAHAILRALGVREAEKNATPFVVDREKVACAIAATTFSDLKPFSKPEWDKKDPRYRRYRVEEADAAITEYERQRAEHEKGGAA